MLKIPINDDGIGGYFRWKTPSWLSIGWAQKYFQAIGLLANAMVQASKEAVLCNVPSRAPVSALAELGRSRGMRRLPGEDDTSYRARIDDAWRLHSIGGTPLAIVEALASVDITATVGPAYAEGDPRYRPYRYAISVRNPVASGPGTVPQFTVRDGDWDEPGTWDDGGKWAGASDTTRAQIETIARTWQDPGAVLMRITVVVAGDVWPATPSDTWDDGSAWTESQTVVWNINVPEELLCLRL